MSFLLPVIEEEHPSCSSGPPVVSILCATYNHANYIGECLDGFLSQKTSFSIEIIVRDDASTDETASIVREYESQHPHLFKNVYEVENQFVKGKRALRSMLPLARGRYIAICEGDDIWTDPLKLQKQVDYIEQDDGLVGCYTGYGFIAEDGSPLKRQVKGRDRTRFTHLGVLRVGCPKTLTLMLKHSAVRDLYEKPESFEGITNGDQLLCAAATVFGDIGYISDVTGMYRVGSGCWSTMDQGNQHKTQVASFLQMALIFNSEDERKAIAQRITMRLADVAILQGNEGVEWQMEVRARMLDLELPFNETFYKDEVKRLRWRLLKRHVRRMLPDWIL